MKTKRIISLILVVLLCLGLCSCTSLAKLKDERAELSEDSTCITYHGNKYIKVDNPDYKLSLVETSKRICVVNKDVPLLLQEEFGIMYSTISLDEKLISNRSDIYSLESNVDYYNSVVLDSYYTNKNTDSSCDNYIPVLINEELTQFLDSTETNEPTYISDDTYDNVTDKCCYVHRISKCDKNLQVCISSDSFALYIDEDNKEYWIVTESTAKAYRVPTELNNSINNLLKETQPYYKDICKTMDTPVPEAVIS